MGIIKENGQERHFTGEQNLMQADEQNNLILSWDSANSDH